MAKGYMFGAQVSPDMTERQASEWAEYIKEEGGSLRFGIPKGIYRTATSNGNPEAWASVENVAEAVNLSSIAPWMVQGHSFWGVRGQIPDKASIENAASVVLVDGGTAGTGFYTRIPVGYYGQKASSGYPEIFIPKDAITDLLGGSKPAYQYAVSNEYSGGYLALRFPVGYYGQKTDSGYPEIRITAEDIATAIALRPEMIKQGFSILGVRGTG